MLSNFEQSIMVCNMRCQIDIISCSLVHTCHIINQRRTSSAGIAWSTGSTNFQRFYSEVSRWWWKTFVAMFDGQIIHILVDLWNKKLLVEIGSRQMAEAGARFKLGWRGYKYKLSCNPSNKLTGQKLSSKIQNTEHTLTFSKKGGQETKRRDELLMNFWWTFDQFFDVSLVCYWWTFDKLFITVDYWCTLTISEILMDY